MSHRALAFPFCLFLIACNDASLSVQRSPPTAEIISHADGDAVQEGETLTFRAIVSDTDDQPDELLASWVAGDRELCPAAAPLLDGTTLCQAALGPEEATVAVVVQDPQGNTGDDHVTLVITPTSAPTVDITEPTAEGVYYSDRLINFTALVSDTEDSPDLLTLAWSEFSLGELPIDLTVDTSGAASGVMYLDAGDYYATLTATDTDGKSGSDAVTFRVGPPNTAPTCEITSPVEGDYAAEGDVVTLRGLVADVDVPEDWITVEWSSDLDGTLGSSTADSAGNSVLTTSTLASGTHTLTMVATDEVGATCTQFVLFAVSTPPTLDLRAPLDGDEYEEGDSVFFWAEVDDGEDSPDDLYVTWESDLDGIFSTEGADSSGSILFSSTDLTVGTHTVLVTVTDTTGLSTTGLVSFEINGAPTAPTVSLSPDPAATGDDLVASIDSPSTDPNGDSVSYSYAWYRNGSLSSASTSDTLPDSATSKGDTWRVEVTPNDGSVDGAAGSASLTIGNTAPSVTSADITPDPADVSDTLTCTATGFSDDDGDSDRSTYAWTVNGSSAGSGSSLSSGFEKGDTVVCTVTPYDGTDSGTAVTDTIVIDNAPPEVTSVTLSPTDPTTDETLSSTVSSSDPDGDRVTLSYAWYVDGTLIGSTATAISGVTWFDKNEVISVVVTPYDGTDYGATGTDSVTCANTAPTAPTVSIDPDPPAGNDDLVCVIDTASSDDDGDTITYTIEWDVGGTAYTSATTTYETGDTVDAADTTRGEVWTCTVTPNDGDDDGSSDSYSVTIGSGDCDSPGFGGTYGTSWTRLNSPPDYGYSLMSWMGDDMDYLWNTYGSRQQYYDVSTGSWNRVSSGTPCNRPWNSMAPYDGDLWMIGCSNVYNYDISTDTWTTMASYGGGDDYNMTVADCDGNIYGYSNNGRLIIYNVDTDTVSEVNSGYGSLYETRLAYDPTEEAVYFGAYAAPNLYRYDVNTGSFSRMTSIAESTLNDIFCGDWSGHLYAAGGSSGTSMWQYDMASNSWSNITNLPVDHGNNGSCTVSSDGYLYVSNGSGGELRRLDLY